MRSRKQIPSTISAVAAISLVALLFSGCGGSGSIENKIAKLKYPPLDNQKFLIDPMYRAQYEQEVDQYELEQRQLHFDLAKAYNRENRPNDAIDVLQELMADLGKDKKLKTINAFEKAGGHLSPAMKAVKNDIEEIDADREVEYLGQLEKSFQLLGDRAHAALTRTKLARTKKLRERLQAEGIKLQQASTDYERKDKNAKRRQLEKMLKSN
jgi:hypothetical protein